MSYSLIPYFSLLQNAYRFTSHKKKAMTEREMEILITFGTWESLQLNPQTSLNTIERWDFPYPLQNSLMMNQSKPRLFFNTARVLTRLQEFDTSINFCQKAIHWCIEKALLLFEVRKSTLNCTFIQ
ncbi:hypothetical protein B1B00_21365 [Bacillus sp. DSM 27956]|nr:hypothetical protein B1B00_21365 [Bacillus sp. DSM 27956]